MPQRYYQVLKENQRPTNPTFVQLSISISLCTYNGHKPLLLRPAAVVLPSLPNGISSGSRTSAAPETEQQT